MSLLNRHFWKFFFGLLAVMAVGFFVMYATHFWTKYQALQADVKAKEEFDRIQKLYQEDTYGGKTPEETLALFIDALKKSDTDLAAKYFVIDEQEKWRENLRKIKEAGKLEAMAKDLNGNKTSYSVSDEKKVFDIFDSQKRN